MVDFGVISGDTSDTIEPHTEDTGSSTESAPEGDADADGDADGDGDADSDADADSDGDVDSDADTDSDADAGSIVDTDSNTGTGSDEDAGAAVDTDSNTDTASTVDTDSGSASDSDSDSATLADTASETGSDGDSATDADTDVDTDMDTDTDVDSDSVTETDTSIVKLDAARHTVRHPFVDGVLNEPVWKLSTSADKVVSGASDNHVLFDVIWDNDNLYIGVRVADPKICVGVDKPSLSYDSVSIFIDPDHSGSETYDAKDVHMIIKYIDNGWREFGASTQNQVPYTSLGHVIDGGYEIEVAVPFSALGVTPSAETIIGFDIGVNDDDNTCGSNNGEISWQDGPEHALSTSGFGELLLSGEEASVEPVLPPFEARGAITAPAVDGTLDDAEWNLGTSANTLINGVSENKVVFDAQWDDANLYLGIRVTDTTICVGQFAEPWNFDSIEVFIDPENNRNEPYDALDVQMIIKYVDANWREYGSTTVNRVQYVSLGRAISDRYEIEVAVPWEGLGITPEAGTTTIGFDLGINDDDNTCGNRDGVLRWQGTMGNHLTTGWFGELTLVEDVAP